MSATEAAMQKNSASEKGADKQGKQSFTIEGDLGDDLQYLNDKLRMPEEDIIAWGLGILLKAYKAHGEIRIIDENGSTVYRSRKVE